MKKRLSALFIVLATAILVFAAGQAFPKYATRLIGFGVFLLTDIFYWPVFRKFSLKRKSILTRLLNILYWLPLSLFLAYMAVSLLIPAESWSPFFRIYLPGIIVPLFLWKFFIILFLLLGEVTALPFNLAGIAVRVRQGRKYHWKRFNLFITAGIITGTLVLGLMFAGFFFWVYDFRIDRETVAIRDLPESFDGFRIVQVSDIHLGSWSSEKPLTRAIGMISSENPDLVVFTGDLVNLSTEEAYRFRDELSMVRAPAGVFAILGNHDYGDYKRWASEEDKVRNNKALENFFTSAGWKLLKNEHVFLVEGNDSLVLAGVENWSANKIWGRRGDLTKSLRGTPLSMPKILLSHDPTHWRKEVLTAHPDIVLTLSGHTHAMQMGWEIGNCRWSPSEWLFPEWAGMYRQEGKNGQTRYLYVNRGLGQLGFPARVGIRPEITVLTLKRK